MSEDTLRNSQASFQAVALRVFDLPHSLYNSLPQIKFSPSVKKLFAVTVFSAVSLIFLARHFKRRKGKTNKNATSPWEQEQFVPEFLRTVPSEKDSSRTSSRQNLSLSLNSKGQSCSMYLNGELYSKFSGSVQSLASVKSANSSNSCACASHSWDKAADDIAMSLVNIPVTTPENLYLMGMELFEEALRRWEQALTFRSRQAEDEASCSSIKLGAGDAIAEESVEDIISAEFIHKLESLLQRAYRLQEEFQVTLGASDPSSLANDIDKDTDITVKEDSDDFCLRDTLSIASTDSFVSAAELSEQRELRNAFALSALCHCPLYEEALHQAEEGKISCRVLRTEMLECLGDTDFLAKLHCVRQACQVFLSEAGTRTFLAETGKKILSAIIVKARKSPKRFEEVFEEMMDFLEQTDHWENTKLELATRGVKHLNFYDIVLDFILMDSFEDLENPPISIQNVVNNRWLNSSFKETAVASSCWSVLKQKKQHMKVPDGFIAHFYAVCEHISPVLAWGLLGPKSSLHDFCSFFKDQVLFFLKDIFDLEKVRYTSTESLAEDMLQLLHHRSELLMAYLGAEALRHVNGCVSGQTHVVTSGLPESRVQ
ncbi:mitoguardin 1-like isoform X1 [Polyodon spathula]|uniref:mitoguardin 1-like isoform X1 n=1 Tax=Polyodon spathula TaxID=7913 RepID=UPI001B7E8E36|nr:mitoguardin 1-like isoform X1 [Polyodon spathula]XP_041134389.1 mitoguardin 1-like isoform X1 [Polyodon spathula]